MKDEILTIQNLSKSFGTTLAVNNISFSVTRGSFFAFLGPNGAGKSTTINILTTLLKQDSGSFLLNNNSDNVYIRNKIGVVFQDNMLDEYLTVKENLLLRGALYLQDNQSLIERYNKVKQDFSLQDVEHKKFKYLSGGQKRRVDIARALLANPEILFLDEPTTGLDPESRKMVWEIIKNLKLNSNLTVFLTTHYMEEASDADYVVILNKGNIVASGTPTELKQAYAHDIFKVAPKNKTEFVKYLTENKIKYSPVAEQFNITISGSEQALKILTHNQANIKSFELVKGSMDDVFLNVVEDKK